MKYKIIATLTPNNNLYISQHFDSKKHNNYVGQEISMNEFMDELKTYNESGIIYLNEILLLIDPEHPNENSYQLIKTWLITDKLASNENIDFLNIIKF